MTDRAIAYRQNLDGLRKAWHERCVTKAREAVEKHRFEHRRDGLQSYFEDEHDAAYEAVEKMLFDSLHWENVEAADISDFAYEVASEDAVTR